MGMRPDEPLGGGAGLLGTASMDGETERLSRALRVAKRWLDRFADPHDPLWTSAERHPSELAREALSEVSVIEQADGPVALAPAPAVGSSRVGTRSGFVRHQQDLARHALMRGEPRAARGALRVLRSGDFAGPPGESDQHLKVLRDIHSDDDEIIRAAEQLLLLAPREA
jgi:hypothetical protein